MSDRLAKEASRIKKLEKKAQELQKALDSRPSADGEATS